MIRALQILGDGDGELYPGEYPTTTPPEAIAAQQQAQATADAEAARARIRTVGGIALLGVVVVGAGALLYLTREPGSVRYRRGLKRGEHRCIGNIRYAVLAQGRLKKIGRC